MTPVELLLLAFLHVFPRVPQPQRGRIAQRHDAIVAWATAGADLVPPAVSLVVCMMETHLGTDDHEGGGCGTPIDVRHRHTAGTPAHHVRALARSFAVCGSWQGAVGRYRSGLCRPRLPAHRAYVQRVMHWVARTHAEAGVPLPADLETPPTLRLAARAH